MSKDFLLSLLVSIALVGIVLFILPLFHVSHTFYAIFTSVAATLVTILAVRHTFKSVREINRQSRDELIEDIANKVIEKGNQQKPQ